MSQNEHLDEGDFFLVALGASAGGLEALEAFFEKMAPDTGMAFVIVQHLSPDYKSLMPELLSNHTGMAIHRVEDGITVEPDSIYLIPPRHEMRIERGRLRLQEQETRNRPNLPIDIFFRSLAADRKELAVGVVLSGTGSDGMRGIRSIKEEGGMVMVQDENSARFDGMPRSAISTGLADFILDVEKMPEALIDLVKGFHRLKQEGASADDVMEEEMARILNLMREETGIDFAGYKQATVVRRLERRISVTRVEDLREYARLLKESPDERATLHRELLIGVTKFFRDSKAFAHLSEKVLPALLKNADPKEPLRIWTTGCSTGEEAYSLAILLRECMEKLDLRLEVKIFATDVDRQAIEVAGNGIYPESIVADLSSRRLEQYFTVRQGHYQVTRRIREMVIFAAHNLLQDPPFTRVDLITCRNLLIYVKAPQQRKVLSLLAYALRPEGFLMLGPSENLGETSEQFEVVDRKWRLYRKRASARQPLAQTLRYMGRPSPFQSSPGPPLPPKRIEDLEQELKYNQENLQATIEELETSNEELQATNEEMLAANEELQSTNEELETINAEYQEKIEELSQLNNDLNNLIRSTRIGTVFLDKDLRIRRFTPALAEVLNILPQDLERPLSRLSGKIEVENMVEKAAEVLENRLRIEEEVQTEPPQRRSLMVRYLPYLTEDRRLEGVVVTVVDVTNAKRTEEKLQGIIDSLPEHICVLDEQGDIRHVNRAWQRFARENGCPDENLVGLGVNYLGACRGGSKEGSERARRGILDVLQGRREEFSLEYPCHSPDRERWFLMHVVPLRHNQGGVAISHLDISRRVAAERVPQEAQIPPAEAAAENAAAERAADSAASDRG